MQSVFVMLKRWMASRTQTTKHNLYIPGECSYKQCMAGTMELSWEGRCLTFIVITVCMRCQHHACWVLGTSKFNLLV